LTAAQNKTLETILVVEDQQLVRDVVRTILERAGFRVLTAGSGAQAIQVESMTGETIHLLLSDVMMPDLSGPSVATILTKLRPEMRVLMMSGYSDTDVLFLNQDWHFIEKPFRPRALIERVNEVLHTSERSQGNLRAWYSARRRGKDLR